MVLAQSIHWVRPFKACHFPFLLGSSTASQASPTCHLTLTRDTQSGESLSSNNLSTLILFLCQMLDDILATR
jgi:hypothetical protein